MTAVRNFDDEYELGKKKGQTFILAGQEFHTKPVAPPQAFLDELTGLNAAVKFILRVLVPEDREAFQTLVSDEDAPISPYQLDQIAAWLIEETSGRPTESPDSSGAGATPISSKSKAG